MFNGGAGLQEDLTKELAIFGFTPNQAKIYLTILQAGSISVGKIAEMSGLYRQDIYKILPKLQKKGLVTKTLGSPIIVQALPVKKTLKKLVEVEKRKSLESIKRMETNLEKIQSVISKQFETESESEEPHFSLLTREKEISNRADLLYEKAKIECNLVLSLDLLIKRGVAFHERFGKAIKNGAKIRLIVEAPLKDERTKQAVERVRPNAGNFSVRLFPTNSPKPFHVIDRKGVWISTSLNQKYSGLPCVLWSNGKNIVDVYQERFERMWNDPKAVTLLSSPNLRFSQKTRS